jgi:hypothetical protein
MHETIILNGFGFGFGFGLSFDFGFDLFFLLVAGC